MSSSGWKEIKLGNVCEINKSSYLKNDSWEYINYLDTGNITENQIDEIKYIVPGIDKVPSRARRKVDINDIIYSTVRPNQRHYGIIKSPLKNMLVSTGFAVITSNKNEVDSQYLYYYLSQDNIVEMLHMLGEHSTSAYPSIKPSDIENLVISLPPLTEQKAIATTLSCLDEKIELNNRINKNLEEIAQAIFKSWFVDFEPFQDGEFEDSELGRIPKGWKVGLLGDILTLNYGKSLPAKKRIDGSIRVYSSAGIIGFHNQALVYDPSIIIGRKGTIGTIYYSEEPSFCIDTAYYATQKDSVFPLLVIYQVLKNLKLNRYNEDSAVPGLNRNTVYARNIIIPPEDVVNKYNEVLTIIFKIILDNESQNLNLSSIRDSLLPKLMNAEIYVPVEDNTRVSGRNGIICKGYV